MLGSLIATRILDVRDTPNSMISFVIAEIKKELSVMSSDEILKVQLNGVSYITHWCEDFGCEHGCKYLESSIDNTCNEIYIQKK